MRLTTSPSSGFCWGVRRAVDLVLAELRKGDGPYAVYGELVHNPQVLQALRDRGVAICETPEDMKEGTLFLRTHGITKTESERLKKLSIKIKDLTCPKVAGALAIAERKALEGYDILILGDPGHQEVKALRSYGGDSVHIISRVEDIDKLPELKKPFLLSQTTQDITEYEEVKRSLSMIYPSLETAFTICDSTERRQQELRLLLPDADCVVVVGGRNSANTTRLAEIAGSGGCTVLHIETADELDRDLLDGFENILLTAGASTPSWSIRTVRERIISIREAGQKTGWIRSILKWIIFGNFHIILITIAAGAAGSMVLGGTDWRIPVYAASLFLYAIHTITSLLESEYSNPSGLRRQEFLQKHKGPLMIVAFLALFGTLALSFELPVVFPIVFGLMLGAFLLYILPLIKKESLFKGIRIIPGSRDVMFAAGWSFLLAILPGMNYGGILLRPGAVLWAGTLFFLFLARCLLADLTDLQGDALMGMDTIPIHVGLAKSRFLFRSCIIIAFLLTAGGLLTKYLPFTSIGVFAGLAGLTGGYIILRKTIFPTELYKRIIADGSLFLTGLVPVLLAFAEGKIR